MADGSRIARPDPDFDSDDEPLDERRRTLGKFSPGERFAYEFDFGDSWTHLCTVGEQRIDPLETLGITPDKPLSSWGWGDIPDQYGRRWDSDDGESRTPRNPKGSDLPKFGPWQWRGFANER